MRMIAAERRAAGALAGVYALRMLGLFLVLPVLALAARDLSGATPILIGTAVGIYGLTQAALQIPFGIASDRLGRKRVIAAGLLLFAAGSALAALADSIELLIAGRALQGAGAIAAALMALAADLTRDVVRTRTMAIIGVSIGMSFSAALVLGPVLHAWLDLAALFWVATALALLALLLLYTAVPTPRSSSVHRDSEPVASQLGTVLANPALLQLDFGIFVLHLVMTGTFVAAPVLLADAGLAAGRHWEVYLPVFLGSVALMAPLVMLGERRDRIRAIFLLAVVLLAAAHAGLALAPADTVAIGLALLVFFTGFNVLEATLPALVSRTAPAAQKGTAMGVYASSQFLGAFAGGLGAGVLDGLGGPPLVFAGLGVVAAVWFLVSLPMRVSAAVSSYVVALGGRSENMDALARLLAAFPGVEEAVVVAEEGVAYLKVDRRAFEPEMLHRAGFDTQQEPTGVAAVR